MKKEIKNRGDLMPIKIFSHKADPDGLGCIILSKICYDEVDYTFCKNFRDLDWQLNDFIDNEEYLSYEKIYITDLCPSVDLLDKIDDKEDLVNKLVVIDHHISNLEKIKDKDYRFININLDKCATSLFYEYLTKHHDLLLPNKTLKEFVLLTNSHDTWKWKEENNLDAYYLETLLHKLGIVGYINHFVDKLNLISRHFVYSEEEKNWIKEQLEEEKNYLDNLIKRVIYKNIDNINYGIIYGLYDYRNSLADKLSDNKSCDVLIFMAVDNETISFRSINNVIEVKNMAKEFNGYGHKFAASCDLNSENEKKLIKKFFS